VPSTLLRCNADADADDDDDDDDQTNPLVLCGVQQLSSGWNRYDDDDDDDDDNDDDDDDDDDDGDGGGERTLMMIIMVHGVSGKGYGAAIAVSNKDKYLVCRHCHHDDHKPSP